jgi:hypothetical protein
MSLRQQISTRKFVRDARSGMNDSELIEKYKLSPNRLQRIFRRLVDGQVLTTDELAGRFAVFDNTVQQGIQSARLLLRHGVDFALHIYEEENPDIFGNVLDITEGGVGLRGIEATIGVSKNFAIPADEFLGVARVEFRARCRWVNKEKPTGKWIGGFEITSISAEGLVEIRKLVQLIELANQVEAIEYDEPSPEETDRREQPRYATGFRLPVHEATKRENKGVIVDVSEDGLRIKGMSAEPGERKTLVIPAYYYGRVTFDSIVIIAECRWKEADSESGESDCGFKILQLTARNCSEFAKLMASLMVR